MGLLFVVFYSRSLSLWFWVCFGHLYLFALGSFGLGFVVSFSGPNSCFCFCPIARVSVPIVILFEGLSILLTNAPLLENPYSLLSTAFCIVTDVVAVSCCRLANS